ncbi:hypothetical protein KC360_g73 [Hortaea werneckii]|nr:hypothetical protein KC360_g73 [Hortaea werneckii]
MVSNHRRPEWSWPRRAALDHGAKRQALSATAVPPVESMTATVDNPLLPLWNGSSANPIPISSASLRCLAVLASVMIRFPFGRNTFSSLEKPGGKSLPLLISAFQSFHLSIASNVRCCICAFEVDGGTQSEYTSSNDVDLVTLFNTRHL